MTKGMKTTGMKRVLTVPVLIAACLGLSCSAHRQAGTGDVAFRLLWNGMSDLDLFVEDPAGGCIYFAQPESGSGGFLDVDCNAGTDQICDQPIENVFWPPGTAPAGRYVFWVYTNSLLAAETPLAYELQVLRGPRVAWRHQGSIQRFGQSSGPLAYDFSRERDQPPVASDRPLPDCGGWVRQRGNWQPGEVPAPVPPTVPGPSTAPSPCP
ncbi:MAG TPA: hypothetical protein VEL74_22195 [Thermoanaerobaculia bacterium]|nr:hypothetical protein [Thermoanaerobaculia bacterium]